MHRLVALIILCLLAAPGMARGAGKLLVVLSEASAITLRNGKQHPTGYFLSELMVPVNDVARMGYEIVVATPNGKPPTVDRNSDAAGYFRDEAEYRALAALHASMITLKAPLALRTLDEEKLAGFDGVFFPGGHAPMADLVKDPGVGRVLRSFHARGLPTALICHGPVALLAAQEPGRPWIYRGYRMTGFSTSEEKVAEAGPLGGEVAFYLDDALTRAGGTVDTGQAFKPRAVRDRELITGQNPMSDREFSQALMVALAEVRLRRARAVLDYAPGPMRFASDTLVRVTPFPKDWRAGVTNIYIGARVPGVSREKFLQVLAGHLAAAKRVFGPAGMRGYLVLSDGDQEIAIMNWPSDAALAAANTAPGREAVLAEAATILEPLVFAKHPEPARLAHPALP